MIRDSLFAWPDRRSQATGASKQSGYNRSIPSRPASPSSRSVQDRINRANAAGNLLGVIDFWVEKYKDNTVNKFANDFAGQIAPQLPEGTKIDVTLELEGGEVTPYIGDRLRPANANPYEKDITIGGTGSGTELPDTITYENEGKSYKADRSGSSYGLFRPSPVDKRPSEPATLPPTPDRYEWRNPDGWRGTSKDASNSDYRGVPV